MRQLTFLLMCFVLVAAPAKAATIFNVDYNTVPIGSLSGAPALSQQVSDCLGDATCIGLINAGFNFVFPNCNQYCSMQIVATPGFTNSQGGHSLRYELRSDQDSEVPPAQDAHNANLIKVFSPALPEIWVRTDFATDVDNTASGATTSQWFCCGTKLHYWKPSGGAAPPSIITGAQTPAGAFGAGPGAQVSAYGDQDLAVCPQGGTPGYLGGGGCASLVQNTAAVVVQDKRFYCFEYHFKQNSSAGASDGMIEFYIDGTRVQLYQNVKWYDGVGATAAQAAFASVEIFRQHSNHQYRYEKNFTVSTTRVGCSGTVTPPDTTTPSQVTGFTVGSPSSSSLVVTATNGTDPDDTNLNLRIERCAGAGCSNFGLVQTVLVVGGSVTTRTDAGLAASTTYCYRANDQDASGNLGPYSATVCGTTSAATVTTRRTLGTDDFNRAGPGLGANYTSSSGGNQIVSNAVEAVTLGAFGLDTRNDALPNDQWFSGIVGTFTGASLSIGFLNVHSGDPNPIACAYERNNSNGLTSEIFVGGVQKAGNASVTWGPGDVPLCEVQGTAVTFSRNGVVVATADSTGSTAGKVSLTMFALGALADNTLDAISWGDYTVASQPTITNAVTDSTGSTLTPGGSTPSFLRVQTDNTNVVYAWNDGVVMVAGRYTQPGGGWASTLSFVCFFAQDANHVESSIATDHQCDSLAGLTLPADTTPPVLTAGAPNGQTLANAATATIAWTSNEPADLHYDTSDKAYASMAGTATPGGAVGMTTLDGLHHSALVSVNAGANTFCARGQDRSISLNVDTAGVCMTFTVLASGGDVTPPTAPTNVAVSVLGSSQASVAFTPGTDAVGVTGNQAMIGFGSGGACTPTTIINPLWGTSSPQQLVNLIGNTPYCLKMSAFDAAGNLSAASATVNFTTAVLADPIPPSQVTGCSAVATAYNVITLACSPATDNVGISNYDWFRCTGAGCTNFNVKFSSPGPTLTDQVDVMLLTTYRFIVYANDFAGNASAIPSAIVEVTTPDLPAGTQQGICPCRKRTQ